VELIDLIGSEEITRIEEEVHACQKNNPGKLDKTFVIKKVPQIEARGPERLVLDPSGFFIIYPKRDERKIYLEHYKTDGTLNEIIFGEDPIFIATTVIERGLISRLDHAAYLGRELEKAQLSMSSGVPYIQDSAHGEKGCEDNA
jgi:tetrahydromethanopterin S-methyltransferase subunit A